ncbi:glycosyltransferase family 2 protein, partial [Eubacteriales bacterium OttesenSCG-928-K08]|nr:glycosyltransferase family 2 protein [Eubacteriales bacterium OttesenSCG-928-K08]
MITISLCMIVRNEEATLARCLNSIKGVADEIIIVDTGSTDTTVDVAKYFTDKVYSFEWVDDFSAARNFSFSKATMEYLLWLDADDVVLPEDREKLIELKKTLPREIDVVNMRYNTIFDSNGQPLLSFY